MAAKPRDLIQLDEEVDGNYDSASDFVFCRIGAPVPLKPSDSSFDLENPPARPLAVSQRFRVLFIAHSEGFFVVKTKDVIGMAKAIKDIEEKTGTEQGGKQPCIHGSSIVYVQIGRVHILALSTDSSTLVATVGGQIKLFSVPSLLMKEREPFFSFSLCEPCHVKDFQWRKDMEKSFVVLSSHGLLYHGNLEGHPKDVMDDVDAVDWSIEGNFLAVARKNTISIFSSNFVEQLEMSLLFQSWTNETDSEGTMKVDSIKWLRSDSIIVGCIHVNEDGKEDGYLVQVIISRGCGFSEASCKPETITFSELFRGIVDDILPFGGGPYLFVSYLDRWELALVANRKNSDDHIVLLGWSVSDNRREAVALEFHNDKFTPRIELQENGNDNFILGLDVDNVSLYENIKLKIDEEVKELSPHCILFSLTCEGKLILFHVARFSEPEPQVRLQTSSSPADGIEENFSTVAPLAIMSSATTARLEDDRSVSSVSNLRQISKEAPNVNTGKELKSFVSSNSSGVDKGANNFSEKEQGRSSSVLGLNTTETSNLVQLPIESAQKEVFSSALGSSVKPGTQSFNFTSADSVTSLSSVGSHPSGTAPARQPKDILTSNEVFTGMSGLSSYQSGSQSTGKIIVSGGLNPKSSSFSSRSILGNTSENNGTRTYTSAGHGFSSGLPSPAKIISLKDSSFTSSSSEGHRSALAMAGNVECTPAICHSPVLSKDVNVPGKMLVSKGQPILDKLKSYKCPVVSESQQEFPKHFYNVNDMTKELDALLSDIEQEGGFRDACTVFQKGSVVALEEGLVNLSERCKMCKATIDGQFAKVQQLQDRMMQVSARQIYMEGIVKQASNRQYWDIWNHRRLGPEFELKRQQIVKLNQNLMNQLIELERHFNAIELNKFGGSGVPTGQRGLLGSLEASRQSQYLHSLYSTLNSQLAAAEKLSDCLSKQMAALNVNSPSVKRQSTAKVLLESIGLAHDADSFQSPDVRKTSPFLDSAKKISLSSSCSAFKEYPRRNTLSALKGLEPETARRRRDSLDRSWASFEPQKTTVKRMLQEDLFMGSADNSFRTTKEQFVSQMLEGFSSAQLKGHDTLPSSLQPSINKSQPHATRALKGIQEKASKPDFESQSTSVFKWSKNLSGSTETSGSKSPVMHVTQTTDTQPPSSMTVLPPLFSRVQNGTNENSGLAEKSKSGPAQTEQHVFSKVECVTPNKTTFNTQSGKPTLGETSSDISSSVLPTTISSFINTVQVKAQASAPLDMKTAEDVLIKSSAGSMKHGTTNIPVNALSILNQNHVSSSGNVNGNALQIDSLMSKSLSSDIVPAIDLPRTISGATPAVLPVHSSASPSSSVVSVPAAPSESFSPFHATASGVSTDNNQTTSLPSSTAAILPPLPSSQFQSSQVSSSFSMPSDSSVSSPPLLHPRVASRTSGPALSPPPVSGFFAGPSSESQATSLSGTPTAFPPISNSLSVVSSTTSHLSGTTFKEKDEALSSAVPQEDEMEEEAPDTTSMLNFGALGGFGVQSTSGTSAPKPNPFGSSFASAATSSASSPVSLTAPPGELFRPASFNLPSSQPVQLSQPMNPTGFSGGFSGFGQAAQIGSAQQAMGSVLGSFGQSRQLGGGTAFGPSGGFGGAGTGGGFSTVAPSSGGFAAAATGGGFSGVASSGGGFAGAATGGGFSAAASSGGGFAGAVSGGGFSAIASGGGFAGASTGGGFGGAASASGFASGGFGAFGGNQGTGGFSAFGGNNSAGARRPPGELLMQMRK